MTGPLAELMGEPAVLFEEKLNYKHPLPHNAPGLDALNANAAGQAKQTLPQPDSDWGQHNDYSYYVANGYPETCISSALVLDDCTVENGPLIMWPGSHKEHRLHDSEPSLGGAQNVRQLGDPVVVPSVGQEMLCKAGSILHFSVLTVHNSRPNFTTEPRRLMIYSHHPESWEGPADLRNGPSRLREAPYERAYLQACIDKAPGTQAYKLAQPAKL